MNTIKVEANGTTANVTGEVKDAGTLIGGVPMMFMMQMRGAMGAAEAAARDAAAREAEAARDAAEAVEEATEAAE